MGTTQTEMKPVTAKFNGKCHRCGLRIHPGDALECVKIDGWVHADCEWACVTRQIDERIAEGWDAMRLCRWVNTVDTDEYLRRCDYIMERTG